MTGERSFGLLGSGEFEPWAEEADRWLLEGADGDGPVLVAPTASAPEGDEVFERWGRLGLEHYERLGVPARVLPLRTRAEAEDPAVAARLDGASMVFFSGGNPAYLTATIGGTLFWERLRERLEEGLAFGGCSAGAAFLGGRVPDPSLADPFTPWRAGLRVFGQAVLAPHWDALDAYVPGLRPWIERSVERDVTLVGIDERTALLGDGPSWRVVGSGHVHVRRDGLWTTFHPGDEAPPGILGAS